MPDGSLLTNGTCIAPAQSVGKVRAFVVLALAWQATAWARIAGGNAAFQVGSQAGAFSTGNSDPVLLALNLAIAALTLVLVFPKLPVVSRILTREPAMLAVYAYSFLSALWAENPGNSVRFALYLLVALLQCAYIGLLLTVDEQLALIGRAVGLFALLSIAGQYLLTPVTDLAPGWTGIFLSKNLLGTIMAIGVVALLLERTPWRLSRAFTLVLCGSVLLLSQSFTAMLCVLACGAVMLYLRSSRRQKLLIVGAAGGTVLLAAALLPLLLGAVFDLSGKDMTLTGRNLIWAFALDFIRARPWFGYGYYGFWISQHDAAVQALGWDPKQAHNGFLDLMLNEGMAGLALLLAVFAAALRRGLRQVRAGDPTGSGRFLLVMLTFLMVHNVAEADFYQRAAWAVFVMAFVAASRSDLPTVSFGDALAQQESAVPIATGEAVPA